MPSVFPRRGGLETACNLAYLRAEIPHSLGRSGDVLGVDLDPRRLDLDLRPARHRLAEPALFAPFGGGQSKTTSGSGYGRSAGDERDLRFARGFADALARAFGFAADVLDRVFHGFDVRVFARRAVRARSAVRCAVARAGACFAR